MRYDAARDEVARRYAAAHAAHYAAGDLREAIALYEALLAEHPEAREAEYSRSQIENIVKAVVPREVLLQAGLDLARARIDRAGAREA